MGQLLMQYARLRNELLDARDLRQEVLQNLLQRGSGTVLQLSLNIPGADKVPDGTDSLFRWADNRLRVAFPQLLLELTAEDVLGSWALYRTQVLPLESKLRCCAIEQSQDFARLLDIDVYAADGSPCDRNQLKMTQRRCLICTASARECIRLGRHSSAEMKGCLEKLLKPFTA